MVKPAQGGSGLGATVVRDRRELAGRDGGLASRTTRPLWSSLTCPGCDVAVTVVDSGDGPIALPAVEIVARDGVYDYAARYTAGLTTWHTPARLVTVWRPQRHRWPWRRTRRSGSATCPGSTSSSPLMALRTCSRQASRQE